MVLLCGVWAFGLGLRVCTSLYSDAGAHVLYFSSTNPLLTYWDFGPLLLLGGITVVISLHAYYVDVRDAHLGDVMRNDV